MQKPGQFTSPGSRSPPVYRPASEYHEGEIEHHPESFSREQIDEIEQLLERIGGSDLDDSTLLEDVRDESTVTPAITPSNAAHNAPTKMSQLNKKVSALSDKDRIWKDHIKDVQTFLEAKKRTTTRTILHERQRKKEVHQSRPWQRITYKDATPSVEEVEKRVSSNYLVHATDMKSFICSRSS